MAISHKTFILDSQFETFRKYLSCHDRRKGNSETGYIELSQRMESKDLQMIGNRWLKKRMIRSYSSHPQQSEHRILPPYYRSPTNRHGHCVYCSQKRERANGESRTALPGTNIRLAAVCPRSTGQMGTAVGIHISYKYTGRFPHVFHIHIM